MLKTVFSTQINLKNQTAVLYIKNNVYICTPNYKTLIYYGLQRFINIS